MARYRARLNHTVLAESDRVVILEGNVYFPPESLHRVHLSESRHWSVCPWKGLARYYTVVADGVVLPDAAWYYPKPSILARKIKNHVAFWQGVTVEKVEPGREAAAAKGPAHPHGDD